MLLNPLANFVVTLLFIFIAALRLAYASGFLDCVDDVERGIWLDTVLKTNEALGFLGSNDC